MTRALRPGDRFLLAAAAAVTSMALLAPCAAAEENPVAPETETFKNYAELYLLLPWISGTVETGSAADYFRWDVLTQGPLLARGITF